MSSSWALHTALSLGSQPELVAFVGGGGKTSLMFALAGELPGRTVVTTTTRIFAAQMRLARAVCYESDLSPLAGHLARHGQCLVVGAVDGDKALGVSSELPGRLLARADVDYVLVEADGSRMRPVKAPAEHEPVVPSQSTLLVPVAGLDALDGPIESVAHRPEQVRRLLDEPIGPNTGDLLTPDGTSLTSAGLAQLLIHPNGGLKNAPVTARVVPFLNKVETEQRFQAARNTASIILRNPRVERVVLGVARRGDIPLEVWRRVTAVVLAAGQSTRMGTNKLLLPWGSMTVLGKTLADVRASLIHDHLVVSGHQAERVEAIAREGGFPVIRNPYYANGMQSSLQAAIGALPDTCKAVLVCLGDQPMIGSNTIDRLLIAYAREPVGIVAPRYRGRRGNPVLIDRRYFPELLGLAPDAAPRVLLQRYPEAVRLVETENAGVVRDLDDSDDYDRWRP